MTLTPSTTTTGTHLPRPHQVVASLPSLVGPGDTVEAAMHRAERLYGVPANWLHRLRYREIKDMPMSAFAALAHAYRAASHAADAAYEAERKLADARGSKVVWLADLVAGKEDEGIMK